MAKIFCLINNKNSGIQEGIIRSLDYNLGWQKKMFQNQDIFLGCLELPFKPESDFWKETANFVIVIDGAILSWNHMTHGDSTTEKLLNLFQDKGEELVKDINGNFSIVIWDKKKKSLHIMSDRLGLRPLYYAQYQGKTFFASEIKAILADPGFTKKHNKDAIIDFFSYEFIPNDQTLVEGIKVFPYASRLNINVSNDRLDFRKYWDFQFKQELPKEKNIKAYAWRLNEITRSAVDRTMQGPYKIGLPLSGGFDSRVIAAMIDKKYYPLNTYTFGIKGCIDDEIARKISRVMGAKHHSIEIQYDSLPGFMIKGVFFTDGMVACNHFHVLNLMDQMRSREQVALKGFAGGVLPRRMNSRCVGKDKTFIYNTYDSCTEKFRRNIFSTDLQKAIVAGKDRFFTLWDDASVKCEENPLDYLNMTQRQRRFSNYGAIVMRNFLEVRLPFADYDFVDFCLKMPNIFKEEDFICREFMNIYYAPFARIMQEGTGLSLRPGRWERKFIEITNKLLGKPVYHRRPAYDYNLFYRTALKDFAHQILLSQKFKDRQIFNQEAVEQVVNDHMAGKDNYAPQLGALITFELWNRLFMDGEKELLEGLVNV